MGERPSNLAQPSDEDQFRLRPIAIRALQPQVADLEPPTCNSSEIPTARHAHSSYMAVLKCLSSQMVQKKLRIYLLAYM